jgi:thiamine pyrophosphate-dependent acetolactate synthase large subunit-like protein
MRATTAEEFDDRLAAALKRRGPILIEAVMPGP